MVGPVGLTSHQYSNWDNINPPPQHRPISYTTLSAPSPSSFSSPRKNYFRFKEKSTEWMWSECEGIASKPRGKKPRTNTQAESVINWPQFQWRNKSDPGPPPGQNKTRRSSSAKWNYLFLNILTQPDWTQEIAGSLWGLLREQDAYLNLNSFHFSQDIKLCYNEI